MSKYEQIVYECLKELFPHFNIKTQYSLSHLKDAPKSVRRSPLDIYIPELKIGIEVDGAHHHHPVSYGGDVEAQVQFDKRRQIDNMKDIALQEAGIRLIRINTDIISSLKHDQLCELLSNLIINIIKSR